MKLHMNWGMGVAAVYIAFAAATMGFVVFALRRPVDLVSTDYYARSLREDQQMAAVRNTRELRDSASVVQSGARLVVVSLPVAQAPSARGTVTLYRASDAAADRVLDLKTDASGHQRISLEALQAGVWSVRVRWNADGRDFYLEQDVFAR